MKEEWDEREARMLYLQEQREFYAQSLSEVPNPPILVGALVLVSMR